MKTVTDLDKVPQFTLRATALTYRTREPEAENVQKVETEDRLQIEEDISGNSGMKRVADLVEATHMEEGRLQKRVLAKMEAHEPRGNIEDWEVTVEAEPSDWLTFVESEGLPMFTTPSGEVRHLAENSITVGAVGALFHAIETGEFEAEDLASEHRLDPFVASVDVNQDEAIQFQDVEQDE